MSTEKSSTDIGKRFRSVRKAHSLTQQAFADYLRISQSAVSEIEKGKYVPSSPIISILAHRYSINEHWLLTGEGEMHAPSQGSPTHNHAESKCCIPPERRHIIKSVIKILDSGTIYAGALEQNILAFEEAVDSKKAMDDLKRENAEIKETLERLQEMVRERLERSKRPPPKESSDGAAI